jgi:hypothetical protein
LFGGGVITFGDIEGVVLNNSITVFFIDAAGELFVEGKSDEAVPSQLRAHNRPLRRGFIEGEKNRFYKNICFGVCYLT